MNIIFVAVCVNIALVNADVKIDIDTIKKILKDSRYNNASKEANEPVEAIQIIPGFYLEKPKSISKSLFRYPKLTQNDAYKTFNKIDTKHDGEKTQTSYTDSKYEHLLRKVLEAVKTIKRLQTNKKYKIAKQHNPKTSSKTANKLRVEKLLANIVNEASNWNDFGERDMYKKKAKSNTMIESNTADQLHIQKLIAKALNAIKKENTVQDNKTYKYGKTLNNIWSSETSAGNVPLQILKEVQSNNQYKGKEKHPHSSILVLQTKPSLLPIGHQASSLEDNFDEVPSSQAEEFENNASEIRDDMTEDEWGDSNYYGHQRDLRRKAECSDEYSDLSGTTIESSEESHEKNPGNPFTIHKNKYKQNWLWNHYMDGDHMNINPLGPQFTNLGPSGPELFFGRKWWYFNQDDFKPMG